MEYMLRTDLDIVNKAPYQPPPESSELYYYYSNHYVLRIVIVCLWVVFCDFNGHRMYSDSTRDHTLFRFGFIYGASMTSLHTFILVHQVIDKTYGRDVANVSSRWFIVFAMLTSICVRTLMLLYIYSRMEFALAGYRYPFSSFALISFTIFTFLFLSLVISVFDILKLTSFQLIVNVDGFSYIVVLFLLFLCLKILFNDVTRFVGLDSHVVHVRVVLSYALLTLVTSFFSLYSSYFPTVCDFVLNFQIFFILAFFLAAEFYFGSMDTQYNHSERPSNEKVLLKPFSTIIRNLFAPSSTPRESLEVNIEAQLTSTRFKTATLHFKIPITARHIPKEPSVKLSLVSSSVEAYIRVNLPITVPAKPVLQVFQSGRRPFNDEDTTRIHFDLIRIPSLCSGDTSGIPSTSGVVP